MNCVLLLLSVILQSTGVVFGQSAKELPSALLPSALAARAVTGAESVRCDAITCCMEPWQARLRVCHVRGVCRI